MEHAVFAVIIGFGLLNFYWINQPNPVTPGIIKMEKIYISPGERVVGNQTSIKHFACPASFSTTIKDAYDKHHDLAIRAVSMNLRPNFINEIVLEYTIPLNMPLGPAQIFAVGVYDCNPIKDNIIEMPSSIMIVRDKN